MKKLVSVLLTAAIAVGVCGTIAACSTEDEGWQGEWTTITCLGADAKSTQKSVPLDPERVAILDYAVLDMMDLYGVGDRVVSSARGTLAYLQDYWDKMDKGEIVDLGNLQSYSMEKLMESDPDIIFIGGRQSGNYTAFEEIAPVVYLSVTAGNIVEETLANADVVAQIFNISATKVQEVESKLNIEARVEALRAVSGADDDTVDTKTAMVLMYTSSTSISALASDGRCSLITSEIGFVLKTAAADSSSSGSDSGSGSGGQHGSGSGSGSGSGNGGGSGSGGQHGSSLSFSTIAAVNPDYIFILNRGYITSDGETSNAVVEETFDNDVINVTTAAKENHIIIMNNPDAWYTAEGGLQALETMIADLEEAFGLNS